MVSISKLDYRKCPCKQDVHIDEAVKIGNRYYHKECAEKKKAESGNSDIEKQELKELKDYIYFELYNKKVNMPFIMKQVSEFKNEYGYRYKGMELTLRYFYGTLGNSMQEGHGIGIIPFMYEEARKHIKTIKENEKLINVDLVTENKMKINIKNKNRKRLYYDISEL